MRKFTHIYILNDKEVGREVIDETPDYKVQFSYDRYFYYSYHTFSLEYEYGFTRTLFECKMKNMVGTDIYYNIHKVNELGYFD